MEKDVNPQSVNWDEYFKGIKTQCPWSWKAWLKGEIEIVEWKGKVLPLGSFQARVYVVNASEKQVEALVEALDYGEDEWLFSYPTYGEYATPVAVLIQQNRLKLQQLREKLDADSRNP